jgi:hypothetical protein
MLESLGSNRPDVPLDMTEVLPGFENVKEALSDGRQIDAIDEEEKTLRQELVATRSKYLQAIRSDQRKGYRRAIQPRIPVETVDNVFDEYLLRMVEGMQNSTSCNNYIFLDGRVLDINGNSHKNLRVNYVKYLTSVLSKYKHMERIVRKNLTFQILKEREQREKDKVVELELKKKEKEDMKASRMQRQMEIAHRKLRLKETEKLLRTIRGNVVLEIKKRREDARVLAESFVELESRSLNSTVASTPAVTTAPALGSPSAPQPVALKSRGPRPQPASGLLHFSGDGFGKLLEFWGLYVSLSSALEVESVPSIRKIESALRVCDPHLQSVKSKLQNSGSTIRYFEVDPNR